MIPLSTPPGTDVVCVVDPVAFASDDTSPIKKGGVYTISSWMVSPDGFGPCVFLKGVGYYNLFHPGCFRLLEIHPSLTALLTADPLENLRLLERDDALN